MEIVAITLLVAVLLLTAAALRVGQELYAEHVLHGVSPPYVNGPMHIP